MHKDFLLKAIMDGLKAELISINLYQNAANNTDNDDVKEFFLSKVEEEKKHYNYLLKYLKYYKEIESEILNDINENMLPTFEDLEEIAISNEFIKRISINQNLFSAIATAVLLEKNAIEFYSNSLEKCSLPILRSFYNIMIKWETKHYNDILKIQEEAEKYFWELNNFEPF